MRAILGVTGTRDLRKRACIFGAKAPWLIESASALWHNGLRASVDFSKEIHEVADQAKQDDAVVKRNENGQLVKGTKQIAGSGWQQGTRSKVAQFRNYCEKLCEKEGFSFSHPVEALLFIGLTGRDPLERRINKALGEDSPYAESKITVAHPDFPDDPKKRVRTVFVDLETRIDCIRLATPYMTPKLTTIEMTGADGGSLFQADRDRAKVLSADPDVRKLFETVAAKAADMGPAEDPS